MYVTNRFDFKVYFEITAAIPKHGKPYRLAFTFSKSAIETLDKGVKYMFKVNNKNTRTT